MRTCSCAGHFNFELHSWQGLRILFAETLDHTACIVCDTFIYSTKNNSCSKPSGFVEDRSE